jgi:hypothetical protein
MSMTKKDSGTLADLTAHASEPERGSDRTFGIVFTILFLVIGCWPLFKDGPVRLWALAVAAVFLILALAVPRALAPLNRLWMAFGLLLGRIISPIMLFLVFLIAVVPTVDHARDGQGSPAPAPRSRCEKLLGPSRATRQARRDDDPPVLGSDDDMMSFLKEFWAFLRVRKKFWLAPTLIAMALLGALIVLSQGSAVAPFIYTLF